MKYKKHPKLKIVHSLEEIPPFESEDDERDWWSEHDLSQKLYRSLERVKGPSGAMVYVLKQKSKANLR